MALLKKKSRGSGGWPIISSGRSFSTIIAIFILAFVMNFTSLMLELGVYFDQINVGLDEPETPRVNITVSVQPLSHEGKQYECSLEQTTSLALPTPQQQWENWPAVAYEKVGMPLVTKGVSFFHQARNLYFQEQMVGGKNTLMDEFIKVYKNRPDPVNMCGIRINHALALFLAVKQIKPTLVVESGVNAGVSTYFIRAASSTTKIFAIDPKEEPICNQSIRWIDSSPLTKYFTGEDFVDLLELDWKSMVAKKEIEPDSTIVFLDDHLHAFDRIAGVMKFGVRHVLVEDNYKYGEGATRLDKISTPKQMFCAKEWEEKGEWLFNNIAAYAEFPPIVPPIMAKAYQGERKKAGGFMVASDSNIDIFPPILRPDIDENDMKIYTEISKSLDIDPTLKDDMSYMQFMNYNQICHLELLPASVNPPPQL